MATFPFRNIGLKFLSICIATLLWLVVAGDRVVERALRVPIEFQGLPPGLEIIGDPPDAIDVRLRGSSGTLGRLGPSDTSAIIDLRNARSGRRLFHITPTQVRVPYGVEVVQVAPATLPMAFENSAVKILEVKPSLEGAPAAGHEVLSFSIDPRTVEVIGPESSLRGLDEAMTEPISIAGATRSVQEIVNVGVADPSVRLRTAQTATVTVQIAAGTSRGTVQNVSIEVANLGADLKARLSIPVASITVKGTQDTIDALRADTLRAMVDAAGLGIGEHVVPVRTRAPAGLTIESVRPETVRLRISK
jgi:hypothetical protein